MARFGRANTLLDSPCFCSLGHSRGVDRNADGGADRKIAGFFAESRQNKVQPEPSPDLGRQDEKEKKKNRRVSKKA